MSQVKISRDASIVHINMIQYMYHFIELYLKSLSVNVIKGLCSRALNYQVMTSL